MESKEISARLLALLAGIAPDIEPASIDPNRDLRDQFDFDSMDSLHFASAISSGFGIAIDEKDYGQLAGLRKACEYVQARLAAGG
jgi:acyl carrier protein